MSQKHDEFMARINTMGDILCTGQVAFFVVKGLLDYKSKPAAFKKKAIHFFAWTMVTNWRTVALELSKLVSEKGGHQHNFTKLLNILRNDAQLRDQITIEEINNWEAQLQSIDGISEKLIIQRDKVYAHTDFDAHKIMNDITVEEVQQVFELLIDTLNSIRLKLGLHAFHPFLLKEPANEMHGIMDDLIRLDNFYYKIEKGEVSEECLKLLN